jgi:soluble epoxide hydrolase/lipid-phosphate phosphatase
MDSLEEKTIKTSRGFIYHYYISSASTSEESSPPLLLLHGFPDSAVLWSRMLPTLSKLPNRLIVPDLLGYGGTSKPTDPKDYAYHSMVRDLLDILDEERIPKVVSIGHDHGVGLAGRLYNHAPDRVESVVLLNVAYVPPNKNAAFNLDAVNAAGTKAFGYSPFDYWHFLTAPGAAQVLVENVDRQWELANCDAFEDRKNWFCRADNAKKYLTDRTVPQLKVKPYAEDPALRDAWIARKKQDGFEAALCWYLALTRGIQSESDQLVLDENIQVNVPLLFIGCSQDASCRAELINIPKAAGLLPNLTVVQFEGVSHRPMYEIPEETAKTIMDFVAK